MLNHFTGGLGGAEVVLLWYTERTMKKTRCKIDAALKAKMALEVLREQATVADLVQRYQVHPNQIYRGEKLQKHAARAFDPKVGPAADAQVTLEIEKQG